MSVEAVVNADVIRITVAGRIDDSCAAGFRATCCDASQPVARVEAGLTTTDLTVRNRVTVDLQEHPNP